MTQTEIDDTNEFEAVLRLMAWLTGQSIEEILTETLRPWREFMAKMRELYGPELERLPTL